MHGAIAESTKEKLVSFVAILASMLIGHIKLGKPTDCLADTFALTFCL
jgi:hypothetical protein